MQSKHGDESRSNVDHGNRPRFPDLLRHSNDDWSIDLRRHFDRHSGDDDGGDDVAIAVVEVVAAAAGVIYVVNDGWREIVNVR